MAITRGGKAKEKLRELGYEYKGIYSYDNWRITNEARDAMYAEEARQRQLTEEYAASKAEQATAALVLDALGLRKRYKKSARKLGRSEESLFIEDLKVTRAASDQAVALERVEDALAVLL